MTAPVLNNDGEVELGGIRYVVQQRQIFDLNGQPLALRAKSARMLDYLLERPGIVISKDDLAEAVWPDTIATDESITRCISDIRKALADESHSVLETYPKRGYLLNVQRVQTKPPSRVRIPLHRRKAAAALMLCIAIVSIWILRSPTIEEPPPIPAIAVLSFNSSGAQDDSAYLATVLAQELVSEISQLSAVRAVPQSLSFTETSYPSTPTSPVEQAGKLKAQYLVRGAIEHQSNEIKIKTELVDGLSGARIWRGSHRGDNEELLTYRQDVLSELARNTPIVLSDKEAERIESQDTDNLTAFQSMLQGRRAISTFDYNDNLEAEKHFRQAIDLDPGYARAYAELATTIAIRLENNWAVLQEADLERALYFAKKAEELDPELWLAPYALGRLLPNSYKHADMDAAAKHLKRAMSLNPASDDARVYFAATQIFSGHQNEVIPLLEATLTSHPSPPFWYFLAYGHALLQAKRYDEAVAPLDQCLFQMPTAPYCLRFQIANFAHLGQIEDSEWAIEEYRSLGFEASVSALMAIMQDQSAENRRHLEDGFRKAGLEN